MYDTLGSAGVLSCGATANLNIDIDQAGDLPTACPSEYLVSVTATNVDDIRTFSAYGLEHVDVAAPGAGVRTTSIGGGYGNASGTSFASPLTAGVIGLLYSAPCEAMMELVHSDPAAGALYIRNALFNGVDVIDGLVGMTATGGRINASNSMAHIIGECGGCPAPFALNTNVADSAVVELSWIAVNGDAFDVRYRPVGTNEWSEVTGIEDTDLLLEGLIPCAMYEFQVSANCEDEQSAISNSYTWISEGCCDTPAGISTGDLTSSSAVISWEGITAAGEYELRYRQIGTPAWTVVLGLTSPSYEITGLENCDSYEVQGRNSCSDVFSEWSESILFNVYCPSYANNSSSEYIAGVQVGPLDHTSGNDGGYGDHSHIGTTLGIGETYSIILTPGYGNWPYLEHFRVYIDLDQNGDFDGADELVYDAPQTTTTAITGDITIPITATPGTSRMRVVMHYDVPVDGPCVAGYDYGETEDYCITLMVPTSVQGTVAPAAINVYPDPADTEIFFNIPGDHADGPLMILVMDNTGRSVAREQVGTGRSSIATAHLANGMYVYRVVLREQEIGRGKFIVVHR
jgi:serine protease